MQMRPVKVTWSSKLWNNTTDWWSWLSQRLSQLLVPEQQQSSQRLPSYWWQEKTRCYQLSGWAPAVRHTLSAKLRTSAAPGPLWIIRVNVHQNPYTDKSSSSQPLSRATGLLVGVLLLEPSSHMPEAEMYWLCRRFSMATLSALLIECWSSVRDWMSTDFWEMESWEQSGKSYCFTNKCTLLKIIHTHYGHINYVQTICKQNWGNTTKK